MCVVIYKESCFSLRISGNVALFCLKTVQIDAFLGIREFTMTFSCLRAF